jgi:hypothetical protein
VPAQSTQPRHLKCSTNHLQCSCTSLHCLKCVRRISLIRLNPNLHNISNNYHIPYHASSFLRLRRLAQAVPAQSTQTRHLKCSTNHLQCSCTSLHCLKCVRRTSLTLQTPNMMGFTTTVPTITTSCVPRLWQLAQAMPSQSTQTRHHNVHFSTFHPFLPTTGTHTHTHTKDYDRRRRRCHTTIPYHTMLHHTPAFLISFI